MPTVTVVATEPESEEEKPDVSAADIELAAMSAKPSNVLVGLVFVLSLLSMGFCVTSTFSDQWADAGFYMFSSTYTASSSMRLGSQVGFVERCTLQATKAGDTYNSDNKLKLPYTTKKFELSDGNPEEGDYVMVKAPNRMTVCRVHGRKPASEVTVKVLGLPDVVAYSLPKPIPTPAQQAAQQAAGAPQWDNDYISVMMIDNDDDPKGEMIVSLGLLLAIAIISSVIHFITAIAAGAVAVIGSIHNCCPTGKCPPVLPVICVGIAGSAAILGFVVQSILIVTWLSSAGSFFTSVGFYNGIAFYTAFFAIVLDGIIISLLAMRQEMRFRTCCAGREHPCAKC